MHDFLARDVEALWSGEAADVKRLATRVVRELARRGTGMVSHPDPAIVAALADAAAAAGEDHLEAMLAEFRRLRVPAETVLDLYVPAAARLLGLDWENDCRSFGEVSIGSARLQKMARALSSSRTADDGATTKSRGVMTVLLAVPFDEDHTLGAVVATQQLRRAGVSVSLALQLDDAEFERRARAGGFDAILISWASTEGLERLKKLVQSLVTATGGHTPVIVGGVVIAHGPDLKELVKADLATNNIQTAVDFIETAAGNRHARQRT